MFKERDKNCILKFYRAVEHLISLCDCHILEK
jgi:hypothetical protein